MRKTKIVCTIGPASDSIEKLEQLIDAGMNVARLNFSHGNYEEHGERISNIRKAAKNKRANIAILLDTRGPEIRTGNFVNGGTIIEKGATVNISMEEVEGTAELFSLTYPGLIDDVVEGSKILIDDGLVELEVEALDKEKNIIQTKALNSGEVKDKKGVNVPNVSVKLPAMTNKDRDDIVFGIEQDVDFIAPSFIRRSADVLEIRAVLEAHHSDIHIIPKIENQEGINHINEILQVSDGLMVARGDLGVEIPPEDVPLVQKALIKKCNEVGKPVITATQMLDSMQRNPRPTRAEASDVANAILDGTDAVMLSGETAAGAYPVESVQTMSSIALKTESGIDHAATLKERSENVSIRSSEAICQSVSHTAMNLDVNAILAPTESGHTARMIAKYRPKAPVLAVTFRDHVTRQLALVSGVYTSLGNETNSTDEMLDEAIEQGLLSGICKPGDRVIITAGVPVGESGTTNLMKIHIIGDVIAKGQGIGRMSVFGKVVVAKTGKEAIEKINEGEILVTHGTDRDMMPGIEKAGGIITVEGGLTSHAAVVGLSLGIPVVVGVENALQVFEDGQDITLDASKGDIYHGHASVL